MRTMRTTAALAVIAALTIACDLSGPRPTIEQTAGSSPSASGDIVCTEEADPTASLLTADDLPAGMESSGAVVDESAGADSGFPPPPAFEENDGRRLIRDSWRPPADPDAPGDIYGVDEFVWQFVAPEGAAAFFDAEAANFAGPGEEDESIEPVGDNGRVFRGTSSGSLGTFDNYQFLFTVGNLAVKVAISGLQPFEASAAGDIAAAAEARATEFVNGPCT